MVVPLLRVRRRLTSAGRPCRTRSFGEDHPTGWFDGPVWLVPLLGAGGLLVALLRRRLDTPEPGITVFSELGEGRVDPGGVPGAVVVSGASLAMGAPLGPEAALGSIGGGLGTWSAERSGEDERGRAVATQAGVGGAFGALISPFVSALLALELEHRPQARLAAMIPTVTAAAAGFAIFFPISGGIYFGAFDVPSFEPRSWHLLAAVGIGLLGAVAALITGLAMRASTALFRPLLSRHEILVPVGAGAAAGLLVFALPLAGFSGTAAMETVVERREELAASLLVAAVAAKVIATSLVFGSGFIGGPIFPMLFIGGTTGVVLSDLVPGLPPALAITATMAAVPAPLMGLPISAVFMVAFVFSLGAQQAVPVGVAALTSLVLVRWLLEGRGSAASPGG